MHWLIWAYLLICLLEPITAYKPHYSPVVSPSIRNATRIAHWLAILRWTLLWLRPQSVAGRQYELPSAESTILSSVRPIPMSPVYMSDRMAEAVRRQMMLTL